MIRLSQTWRQKQTASNTAVAVKNTSHTSDIEEGTPRRSQRLAQSKTVKTSRDTPGSHVLQDITRFQDRKASGKNENSPNSSGQSSIFSTSFGFEFDADIMSAVDKMEKDHLGVKKKSLHVPGLSPITPICPQGSSSHASPAHANVRTMRSTPKDKPGNENVHAEVVGNQGSMGQSCTYGEPKDTITYQISKMVPKAGNHSAKLLDNVQPVSTSVNSKNVSVNRTSIPKKNYLKSLNSSSNSMCNPGASKKKQADESKQRSPQRASSAECCQLSYWGLPDCILQQYEKIGIETMFEWQADCLCTGNVLNGGNLVYSAPTSAGKTMVAELLMLKRILETKCKALFILPFVSVAREKMFYLQRMFQEAGIKVDGYMGSQAPSKSFNALDVAVCTIEKANGLVNRLMEDGQLHTVGTIVVDEMHLIGDSSRGYLLELLLTKVLYMREKSVESACSARGNQVQIIGMSATLPNLDVLAKWLRADMFFTNFRPVPLTETLKVGPVIYDREGKKIRELSQSRMVSGDDDHVLLLCQETVEEGHAVLMFCPTKSWCEKLAESVARHFFKLGSAKLNGGTGRENGKGFVKASSVVMFNYERLKDVFEQLKSCQVGLDSVLGKTLRYGVAYHHAGLTFDERDIIEGAFRQGIIKVLIATSTLSSGVNLPARRVIIRSPMFFGKLMDGLVYKQMSGRAGRKGVDSQGESILICKPAERQKASSLLHADLKPVESCLVVKRSDEDEGNGVKRALLEVIASGVATTPADVQRYASCTFYVSSKAQEDGRSTEGIIESTVDYLARNEFMTLRKTEEGKAEENPSSPERYVPTQLGQATLASALSPDEALVVFADLRNARKCFVLENELHILYQVTPIYLQDQWPNLDWYQYLKIWEHLPSHMKRVAELVGIEERFLTRAIRGRVPTRTEAHRRAVGVHKRFYVSLALHDLVREVPLDVVARKFGASRGMLQSLQSSAATFAGMVTVFCHKLGWVNLEMLLSQFHNRLTFGVERELCDLVRISALNGHRARLLYNAGYHTVAAVASASAVQVERHLRNATPFQSGKRSEWESERDLQRRMRAKCVWVDGGRAVTEAEAARAIVGEAREILKRDASRLGMEWKPGSKISDGNAAESSAHGAAKNTDVIVPRGSWNGPRGVTAKPLDDASTTSGITSGGTECSSNVEQSDACVSSSTTSNIPETSSVVARNVCRQLKVKSIVSDIVAVSFKTTAKVLSATSNDHECLTVDKTASATDGESRTSLNLTSSASLKATAEIHPTASITNNCPTAVNTAATTTVTSHAVSNLTTRTPVKNKTKLPPTTSTNCQTTTSTTPTTFTKSPTASSTTISSTACTSKQVSNADTLTKTSWLNSSNSHRPHKSRVSSSIPRNAAHGFLTPSRTVRMSRRKERSDIPGSSPEEIRESKTPLTSHRQRVSTADSRGGMLPSNGRDPSLAPALVGAVNVRGTVGDSEADSRSLKRRHSVNSISVGCSSSKRNLVDLRGLAGSSKDPKGTTEVSPDVVSSGGNPFSHNCSGHSMSLDKDKTKSSVQMTGGISLGEHTPGGKLTDPGENVLQSATKKDTADCKNTSQVTQGHSGKTMDREHTSSTTKTPENKQNVGTILDESPELITARASPDNDDDFEKVVHGTPHSDKGTADGSAAFSPELYSEALFPEDESPQSMNNGCRNEEVVAKMSESSGFEMRDTSLEENVQNESTETGHLVSENSSQNNETAKGLAVVDQKPEGIGNPGRNNAQEQRSNDVVNLTAICTSGMFDSEMNDTQSGQSGLNGKRSPDGSTILDRSTSEQSRRGSASSFSLRLSQSFEEPSDSDLSTRTLAAVVAMEENQRETKDAVSGEGSQGTQGFHVDSDISNDTVAAIEAMENEMVGGMDGTDVHGGSGGGGGGSGGSGSGGQSSFTAVKDRSLGFVAKSIDSVSTLGTKPNNSPSVYPALRSQFSHATGGHCGQYSKNPGKVEHSVNDDSLSFAIIDVTEGRRLFDTFLEECQSKSFSFAVALEKLPLRTATIGGNFRKGPSSSPSSKGLPLSIEDEGVAVVGVSLCWEDRDAYFVSLRETEGMPKSGRDPKVAAGLTLKERLDGLKGLLGLHRKQQSKTAFGIKEQYKVLSRACGLVVRGELQDPTVATWLLGPEVKERNFHHLVEHFLPQETDLLQGTEGNFGLGGLGIAAHSSVSGRMRSAVEVVLTMKLMEHVKAMLKAEGLLSAFTTIEMPVVGCLARMELNGVGFSNDECENIKCVLKAKLRSLEQDAYRVAKRAFCLASPEEVSHVLFLELKLPPDGNTDSSSPGKPGCVKPTRGGKRRKVKYFSTSKDVLEKLLPLHPLPRVVLEWRRVNSALTKVVFPVQKEQTHCGPPLNMSRIHSLALTHTATGRVSFVEPNLQNVPKDFDINLPTVISDTPPADSTLHPVGKRGRKRGRNTGVFVPVGGAVLVEPSSPGPQFSVSMRSAFVPFSSGVLLAADYSQLELRLIAHVSGDEKLARFLNAGGDIFKMIAGELFHIPQEAVSGEQRQRAKQVCYGIIYGIGAKALGQQLGVNEEDAAIFVDAFKARFSAVRSYLKETVDECRKLGYVTTVSGRKRYLPNIRACNAPARAHAERQAVNTTIQGSAADLVKLAMVNIDRRLCDEFPTCWRTHRQRADDGVGPSSESVGKRSRQGWNFRGAVLVLQLHDELLFEVAEDDFEMVVSIVKEEMENAMKLTVKIPVNVKSGKSWGTLEPVEGFGQ